MMQVFLNRLDGLDDAIVSMYLSKRTLTRSLEREIREEVSLHTSHAFEPMVPIGSFLDVSGTFEDHVSKLIKWGKKHLTLLRFIDCSFTVYGLHRGAQDDLDSHAMRMNDRIIRASTRLSNFQEGERSNFYYDKILPLGTALAFLGIQTPTEIEYDDNTYVRAANGYIRKGFENDQDVKRGLYMLSIPSNFIFKIQIPEFAHIYRERCARSGANPELKEAVESMASEIESATQGYINRDVFFNLAQ